MSSSNVVFRGKSGERYRFQTWPIGTAFKPVAAVYVVTKRTYEDRTFTTKASHQPLAIGETPDLSATFVGKADMKALAAKGANCICVLAIAEPERRSHVERDLIEGNEVAGGSLRYLFDLVYPQEKRETPPGAPD
jgi:hypothetical protein